MSETLARVKRAGRARTRSDDAFRAAVLAAHAEGISLRMIAEAAGVSHMLVQRIVQSA